MWRASAVASEKAELEPNKWLKDIKGQKELWSAILGPRHTRISFHFTHWMLFLEYFGCVPIRKSRKSEMRIWLVCIFSICRKGIYLPSSHLSRDQNHRCDSSEGRFKVSWEEWANCRGLSVGQWGLWNEFATISLKDTTFHQPNPAPWAKTPGSSGNKGCRRLPKDFVVRMQNACFAN